jgi:SAM-dependent methyltransferase
MAAGTIAQLWQHVQQIVRPPKPFDFRGFPVDPVLARRTGAPPEHYAAFAAVHERLLATLTPIEPHHVVLEAGCGTGMDAILLSGRLRPPGRYTGFDIARANVFWCTTHIARALPHYAFHHFDVRNETYNPGGTIPATSIRFPEADAAVDRFIAQSVFTHLLPDVAAHYLRELRRVLKPDGLALVTCFLATPQEIVASRDSPVPAFRFPHQPAPGVHTSGRRRPSASVAYERDAFLRLLRDARLTLTTVVPGYWALGRAAGDVGQDIIVLTPAPGDDR